MIKWRYTWFCTVLHEYAIGVLYLYYIANLQYFYGSISAGWRSVLSKNPVDFPEGVDAGDLVLSFLGPYALAGSSVSKESISLEQL